MRDMLSGLFRRLVKRKVIDDNPAEDLPKFKRKAKKARLKTTDSDMTSLFEAADVRLRAMLLLSRRNLRIGEILGLTEACIDGRRVTISGQANTIKHPDKGCGQSSLWALTHLKHNGDERVMVLDESELQILQASLMLAKPVNIYNTVTGQWETHRFVVPNANGDDWHYNDFIRALKALTKKCNVQFTSHDGRRLFATNILAEDHVSPDAVRISMGHSDINVTMLYAQSDRDSEKMVNEVASRQVREIFGLSSALKDVEPPRDSSDEC
jgi:integrase